jgi:hypothetical protein
MLEIDRDLYSFRRKDIWFSNRPYDIDGYQGVVFYSCKDKVDAPGFRRKEFTTIVIDLTQDLDTLWNNIDRQSSRKKINKAWNNGVKIHIDSHHREFFELYQTFRREKGLMPWVLDVDFMKRNGTLFVAEFDGEIVSGHFFLSDRDNLRGLISGSRRIGVDHHTANVIGYANRLIIWEAIKYAREQGMSEYDMGGYYSGREKNEQMERINSYKASFGGRVATRYHYEKYYSKLFDFLQKAYGFGMSTLYSRPIR